MRAPLFLSVAITGRPITAVRQIDQWTAISLTPDQANQITLKLAGFKISEPLKQFHTQQLFAQGAGFGDQSDKVRIPPACLALMQPTLALPLADIARLFAFWAKVSVNV